jgi:sulfite reductase beta subunit-like hemoprotein
MESSAHAGRSRFQADSGQPLRILGTYPQKQQGLYMQRIPFLGGRIEWRQWRAVAELAMRFTPGTPLHLTTRQNIELHNVQESDIPSLYRQLEQQGICTYGACGDSIRNITVSPACDLHPEDFDLLPAARLLHQVLNERAADCTLPRKFKICLCGLHDSRGGPYISDLGFIVRPDGTFRAVGAGSLGPSPQTGIDLYDQIRPEDILPLAAATLDLFIELADRTNRSKARLRHVRRRMGDAAFRAELNRRFVSICRRQTWPLVQIPRGRAGYRRLYTLQLPDGDLPPEAALSLVEAAEPAGAVLRINHTHGLELYGSAPFELPSILKPFVQLPCVVLCPGADSCPRAIVHTKQIGSRIRQIEALRASDRPVAVSGCPNGCAQSAAADIGLLGRIRTLDGNRQECFDVFLNGGGGQTPTLAAKIETISAEEIEFRLTTYLKQRGAEKPFTPPSKTEAVPDARPVRGSGG